MKKKIMSLLVGMTLVAGLFLTGCGSSNANAENLKDTENAGAAADASDLNQAKSITIAVIGSNSLVINADRLKGFVQDAVGDEVEVNYEVFQSGPETLTALQSGTVDIVAGTGALPIVNFASNGSKFVIVAATISAGDSYIVATPESGITSIEDLKGKQVAVALGTGSHYLLLAKLAEAGLTIDDIEVANLGGPDALTAFVGGEVDVQVNSVSLIQPIVSDGSAVVIGESDETYSYVEANVDFAAENPELVSKVIYGFHQAAAYAYGNLDEAAAEVADTYDLDADNLKLVAGFATNYDYIDASVLQGGKEQVKDYKQFAFDNELITEDFDVDALFDDSYVQRAREIAEE